METKNSYHEEKKQTKMETIDVDNIWHGLGKWGKFQVRQLIVQMVAIWSCGFHMLSVVFIGMYPCADAESLRQIFRDFHIFHQQLFVENNREESIYQLVTSPPGF